MKRKILLLGMLLNLFSFTSFASAPITVVEPESEALETIEETVDQDMQSMPQENVEGESLETTNEIVETESMENLTETESEYPVVTLNFDVEFTFDTEEEPIYLIQVQIPNGLSGGDGEEYYEIINLLYDNNFISSYQMTCYYDGIQLNANIDGDNAYLYNVEFEGLEPATIFGDTIRNSGYISNPQNGNVYNIHLIVSQNDDATIKSPDDLPYNETDSFYDSVISGEYGESRAAEIESSIAEENPTETVEPVEEENSVSIIVIVIIVAIIILIVAGILYIRRLQKDDDDD